MFAGCGDRPLRPRAKSRQVRRPHRHEEWRQKYQRRDVFVQSNKRRSSKQFTVHITVKYMKIQPITNQHWRKIPQLQLGRVSKWLPACSLGARAAPSENARAFARLRHVENAQTRYVASRHPARLSWQIVTVEVIKHEKQAKSDLRHGQWYLSFLNSPSNNTTTTQANQST